MLLFFRTVHPAVTQLLKKSKGMWCWTAWSLPAFVRCNSRNTADVLRLLAVQSNKFKDIDDSQKLKWKPVRVTTICWPQSGEAGLKLENLLWQHHCWIARFKPGFICEKTSMPCVYSFKMSFTLWILSLVCVLTSRWQHTKG